MQVPGQRMHLRNLSWSLRVAATCLLLIITGGYAASLYYMQHHISQKDGDPALTWVDLVGTYHGVNRPAPVLSALDSERHEAWLGEVPEEELQILRDWLAKGTAVGGGADPVQQGWDALPPGASEDALTPADVIDERCVRCHAAGATDDDAFAQVALDRWPTLKNYVYSKQLDPISTDILAQSTHAHALSIPIFTLIVCAMALATGCPRWLRHGVAAMTFVGLLLDFGGMWLARSWEPGCLLVVGGGALYGIGLGLGVACSLWALWCGRPPASADPS